MSGLLIGEDEKIASWTFSHFKLFPTQVNRALGIVDKNGKVCGSILFQCYNGCNVEVSYYGERTMTPGVVRSIAKILLNEFNASRLTVVTSKKRKRLMKSVLRLGFRLEGVQKCYYGHQDNVRNTGVRFVMFRERIAELAGVQLEKKAI